MPPAPTLPPRNVTVDHTKPLTVNVTVQSVHVVGYKLWKRPNAASQWQDCGSGTSEDNIVDSHDLGVTPAGSSMVFWLGIAGPPKSKYKVHVIFIQDGKVVNGGLLEEAAETDTKGAAVVERKVVFP